MRKSILIVVALTVAEYVPRQVVHLRRLLRGLPLL